MNDIEHVGYDRDGEKVWLVGPGQYIGAPTEQAVRTAMATRGWEPFTRAEYVRNFGRIRPVKP